MSRKAWKTVVCKEFKDVSLAWSDFCEKTVNIFPLKFEISNYEYLAKGLIKFRL